MGAINCSSKRQSHTRRSVGERICYDMFMKTDHWAGAQIFCRALSRAKIYGDVAEWLEKLGESVYHIVSGSSDMTIEELLNISAKQCPSKLTSEQWNRFAASVVLESTCKVPVEQTPRDSMREIAMREVANIFTQLIYRSPRFSSSIPDSMEETKLQSISNNSYNSSLSLMDFSIASDLSPRSSVDFSVERRSFFDSESESESSLTINALCDAKYAVYSSDLSPRGEGWRDDYQSFNFGRSEVVEGVKHTSLCLADI